MPTVVPESDTSAARKALAQDLGEGLAALLEFTGATSGWVGMNEVDSLTFPVRLGSFPDAWLTLQQGRSLLWGFAVGEGPTLLNDLPALPALGEPSLRNLISCPLMRNGASCGQVVAANKSNGFTSHDAAVLQALAHWMSHRLARVEATPAEERSAVSYLPHNALNRISEGVFLLDETRRLVWANATWLKWTGFSLDELVGQAAPYPFWISYRVLAVLGQKGEWPIPGTLGEASERCRALPFRRRDDSIFWCNLEAVTEELGGRSFVMALLRQTSSPVPPSQPTVSPGDASAGVLSPRMPVDLPFAAALTNQAGRIIWSNELFSQLIAPLPRVAGAPLHERFHGVSAGSLEGLTSQASNAGDGRLGRMVVQPIGRSDSRPLVAYWSTLSLPYGAGFFFGFSEDWSALGHPDDWTSKAGPEFRRPDADCLVLLLSAEREVAFWDERWLDRTGLSDRDLSGVPTEVALDWLFPHQGDRDRVADLLHQPDPLGGQHVLDLVCPGGSRPQLCTFLPLCYPEGKRWLLLAGDPTLSGVAAGMPLPPMRSFLRGLGHLLNHYVLTPQSLAEAALDRGDLTPDVATIFEQILDCCQVMGRFLASLQNLAAAEPPAAEDVSLPDLVREFLRESQLGEDRGAYELDVDLPEAGFLVRINRRMVKTVLGNLFTNARQALLPDHSRRIRVRVFAQADTVGCSISDNGEGLPIQDWVQLLAPFASTKGPFARDARHAAMEAVGLGLAVSRHLLALHGGRLELRAQPEGGTSALFFLPRAGAVAQQSLPPLEPVLATDERR